jgi:hypothetical protein
MFEGESATVEVISIPEDRHALSPQRPAPGGLQSRLPLLVATLVFAVAVTFGRDFLYNQFGIPFGSAATWASIVGLLFFLLILNFFGRRRPPRDSAPRGAMLRGYRLTAAPDGLHLTAENLDMHYRWAGIIGLNETDAHLIIHTDGAQAIPVPKRSFASKDDASRFAIIIRSHIGEAP